MIDTATLALEAYPNPGVTTAGGAGIQAAQFVTGQKADAVISGDFGPHAFQALDAANLPMYVFGNRRTAREVVAQFADNCNGWARRRARTVILKVRDNHADRQPVARAAPARRQLRPAWH
jgi:predicted Fe-Mo cluster-binding NifX family protein